MERGGCWLSLSRSVAGRWGRFQWVAIALGVRTNIEVWSRQLVSQEPPALFCSEIRPHSMYRQNGTCICHVGSPKINFPFPTQVLMQLSVSTDSFPRPQGAGSKLATGGRLPGKQLLISLFSILQHLIFWCVCFRIWSEPVQLYEFSLVAIKENQRD